MFPIADKPKPIENKLKALYDLCFLIPKQRLKIPNTPDKHNIIISNVLSANKDNPHKGKKVNSKGVIAQ